MDFLFVEDFNFVGLRNSIFEKSKGRSEVKNHPISISLKEFSQACNLPFINQDYYQDDNE
ncbi:hypothetical protein RYX36_012794, partial [Vicia faba]